MSDTDESVLVLYRLLDQFGCHDPVLDALFRDAYRSLSAAQAERDEYARRLGEAEARIETDAKMEAVLTAENARLREALESIRDDTTDREFPFRSLGASGPVKDVARAALAQRSEV